MNLLPPINVWFWVLIGVTMFLFIGLVFWTLKTKRSWKLIPFQFACLAAVISATYFLGRDAAEHESQRLQQTNSHVASILAADLQDRKHEAIVSSASSGPRKVTEALLNRWIESSDHIQGIFTIRKKPDGKPEYVAGYTVGKSGKEAVQYGAKALIPADVIKRVWNGQSQYFVENGPDGVQKFVMLAAPVRDAQREVDSVVVVLFPAKDWMAEAVAAETNIIKAGAILSLLVLIVAIIVGEVLHSMAIMRVSKAELMLQGERIREQMEMIAEKNQEMADSRSKLQEANSKLHALATMDGLTGVMNHRSLMEFLSTNMQRNSTIGSPCSVVLLDIDNFKQLNDQFGHMAGDDALRVIAHVMKVCTPPGCGVGRYGGEEFMMVLPGATESAALAVAEEVRRQIQMAPQQSRTCTASLGVSTVYSMNKSEQMLIDEADRAMYHSKRSGKNRVTHYGHGIVEETA